MGEVKVKLNMGALSDITRGPITDLTQQIADRCGDGFVGDVIQTDRPHGAVRAVTRAARDRNRRENTILKAALG